MNNENIESRLYFTKNALDTVLSNPSIKNKLLEFGYDDEKLQKGLKFFEKANALHHQQLKEYGEQFEASAEVEKAYKAAWVVYIKYIKIARLAFRQKLTLYHTLQLEGERERTYSNFIKEALNFYEDSLSHKEIIQGLKEYNITKAKLEEGQKLLLAFRNLRHKQLKEMSEAVESTELRDDAIDAMEDWTAEFITISRIALEEAPEELQAIGVE
jgi:hypothetical protein